MLLVLIIGLTYPLSPGIAMDVGTSEAIRPRETFIQGVGGQTVTSSLTLSHDILNCNEDGIVIAADDVVLDCGGHTISGCGSANGVTCSDCRNVTVKNCVIRNFKRGIHFQATDRLNPELSTNNVIAHNTLTQNQHGVVLIWSHAARITDNEIVANTDSGITLTGAQGIYGLCSNHATISGNTVSHNRRGLVTFCAYKPQEGNRAESNTFSHNVVSVTDHFQDEDRIRYRSNRFDNNLNTVFFRFHGDHHLKLGDSRAFDVAVHGSDGAPCSNFVIRSVETSPRERVSYSKTDNRILGSFTPGRQGLYSLSVAIEGCSQELIRQRFWFGQENPKTFYLIEGDRRDVGRLVSDPPDESVSVYCTMWVQAGFHDVPQEPGIVKITRVRSSMWSNYRSFDPGSPYSNVCSLEFDHTFSRRGDVYVAIDGAYEDALVNVIAEFDKGLFIYDPSDWLGLSVKYWGRDPDWTSESGRTSKVDVHYLVTDAPVIENVSGREVRILSATSPKRSASRAEIVLEGRGETSLSVQMEDARRSYKVAFDGVSCDRSSACRYTQEDGAIRLHVELESGHEHTIAIARDKGRRKSR